MSIHSTLSGTEEERTAVRALIDEIEKKHHDIISKILFRVFSRLMNVPLLKKFSCDVKASININPDCLILEANMD